MGCMDGDGGDFVVPRVAYWYSVWKELAIVIGDSGRPLADLTVLLLLTLCLPPRPAAGGGAPAASAAAGDPGGDGRVRVRVCRLLEALLV